jgi:voltage-gated potassium channel
VVTSPVRATRRASRRRAATQARRHLDAAATRHVSVAHAAARLYLAGVTWRRTAHRILEGEPPGPLATAVRIALATLIVANVAGLVLETVRDVDAAIGPALATFETVSVVVFTLEYFARLWVAPEQPRFATPLGGRVRWALSPAAIVDLLAILPSLLAATGFDLRALRLVRLSRLLRIAKLGRYSLAVQTLERVLRSKAPDLLSLLFLLLVLLMVSSTLMYHLEHDAQPNGFSSIPATMWWGIVTLTTIGYGDLTPVTAGGRVLGGVIAILGIGMFALPAGLLGAAFVDELGKARASRTPAPTAGAAPHHCPHCGKQL